jgi:hypothetical protein
VSREPLVDVPKWAWWVVAGGFGVTAVLVPIASATDRPGVGGPLHVVADAIIPGSRGLIDQLPDELTEPAEQDVPAEPRDDSTGLGSGGAAPAPTTGIVSAADRIEQQIESSGGAGPATGGSATGSPGTTAPGTTPPRATAPGTTPPVTTPPVTTPPATTPPAVPDETTPPAVPDETAPPAVPDETATPEVPDETTPATTTPEETQAPTTPEETTPAEAAATVTETVTAALPTASTAP